VLILTRSIGTAIIIGNHIVVKVIKIDGDKVRLGIEAPKEMSVHREVVSDKAQSKEGSAR